MSRRSGSGWPAERLELVVRKLERSGRDVLFEVRHARRARNRQHVRGAPQQPGERDLERRRPQARRLLTQSLLARDGTRSERKPWDERQSISFADVEHGLAVTDAEAVLDGHDLRFSLRDA